MYLFVVNKKSGNGQGLRAWLKVETALKQRHIHYQSIFTEHPQQAAARIEQIMAERKDILGVAVVGGDGTIHSVLPVMKTVDIPLAVIPAGSGNDTARAFGIPRDPLSALDVMLGGHIRHADLISVSGTPILTALAIGFDAQVAENVNNSMYKKICNFLRIGRAAYIIGIVHTLLSFKTCRVTVSCDASTESYEDAWLTAISNVPNYGGGLHICPEANPESGQLDVCIVHGCSRLQLLRLFPTVIKGKHVHLPFVTMLRGKSVSVAFKQQRLAIGDGENMSHLPYKIIVEPKALKVFASNASF